MMNLAHEATETDNEGLCSLAALQEQVEQDLDMAQSAVRRGSLRDARRHLAAAVATWSEYEPVLAVYSGAATAERIASVTDNVARRFPTDTRSSAAGQVLLKEPSRINKNGIRRKNVPGVVPDKLLALAGSPR